MSRAGQGRAGQGWAGLDWAEQGRVGQGRIGQGGAGLDWAKQGNAGLGRAGHDWAGLGSTGLSRADTAPMKPSVQDSRLAQCCCHGIFPIQKRLPRAWWRLGMPRSLDPAGNDSTLPGLVSRCPHPHSPKSQAVLLAGASQSSGMVSWLLLSTL